MKGSLMVRAKEMSADHKAALAKGRAQAKAVRNYLQMLEQDARRSSNVSADQLNSRIREVESQIRSEKDPIKRVELIQRRLDLEAQWNSAKTSPDPQQLEDEFVRAVKEYSERKGISYAAWRELGVPAGTLRAAGVPRTRRS